MRLVLFTVVPALLVEAVAVPAHADKWVGRAYSASGDAPKIVLRGRNILGDDGAAYFRAASAASVPASRIVAQRLSRGGTTPTISATRMSKLLCQTVAPARPTRSSTARFTNCRRPSARKSKWTTSATTWKATPSSTVALWM